MQKSAIQTGGAFANFGDVLINAGIADAISELVICVTWLADKAIVTKDELRETAAISYKEYQDLTNEASSLNDELETNKKRIVEINNL